MISSHPSSTTRALKPLYDGQAARDPSATIALKTRLGASAPNYKWGWGSLILPQQFSGILRELALQTSPKPGAHVRTDKVFSPRFGVSGCFSKADSLAESRGTKNQASQQAAEDRDLPWVELELAWVLVGMPGFHPLGNTTARCREESWVLRVPVQHRRMYEHTRHFYLLKHMKTNPF